MVQWILHEYTTIHINTVKYTIIHNGKLEENFSKNRYTSKHLKQFNYWPYNQALGNTEH